jgi:hypothetical protein
MNDSEHGLCLLFEKTIKKLHRSTGFILSKLFGGEKWVGEHG